MQIKDQDKIHKQSENKEINLGTKRALPNNGFFQITHRTHNFQRCKHQFHNLELQPDRTGIPHMKHVMGRW